MSTPPDIIRDRVGTAVIIEEGGLSAADAIDIKDRLSNAETAIDALATGTIFAADYGDLDTAPGAAINAAIAAASTAGGGMVYVNAGEWTLETRIAAKDNVVLFSRTARECTLVASDDVVQAMILGASGDTVSRFGVSGITLDGGYDTHANVVAGVQISNGSHVAVADCRLINMGGAGVLYQGVGTNGGTPYSEVRDCEFDGIGLADGSTGFGIWFKDASSWGKAIGNRLDNIVGGMGIGGSGTPSIGYPRHLTITENDIRMAPSDIGFEAIGLTEECWFSVITDNTIIDSQDNGISCSASYSTVTGNTIDGAENHGITTHGPCTTISANVIHNVGRASASDGLSYGGVLIDGGGRCVVAANTISATDSPVRMAHGVKLNGAASNNDQRIVGNMISNNTGARYYGIGNSDIVRDGATVEGRIALAPGVNYVDVYAERGDVFEITLSGNITSAAFHGGMEGQVITVTWKQDGTGGRSYVWPSVCKFAGGSAPTKSTTANYRDTVTFEYAGGNWYERSRAVAVR